MRVHPKGLLLLLSVLFPSTISAWDADTNTRAISAASAATGASTNSTDAVKKDLARLQGKWLMVSGSADGTDLPSTMLKDSHRICEKDETTVTLAGQLMMKARFILNPSTTPKSIDYKVTTGLNAGKTQLGIYDLDGDTAKFCFSAPGQLRPTDFTTKIGDTRALSIWKKEKPDKK